MTRTLEKHKKSWGSKDEGNNNIGFSLSKILDKKSIFYGSSSFSSVLNYFTIISESIDNLPKPNDSKHVKALKYCSTAINIIDNLSMSSRELNIDKSSNIKKISFGTSDDVIYDLLSEISIPDEVFRGGRHFPGVMNLYRFKISEDKYIYWAINPHDEVIKSIYLTNNTEKQDVIDFIWDKIGKVLQLESLGDSLRYLSATLSKKNIFGSTNDIISKLKKDYDHFYEHKMSRGYLLIGKPGTGKTGIVNSLVDKTKGRVFVISGLGSMMGIENIESLSVNMKPDFIIFDDCDRSGSDDQYIRSILKLIEHVKEKNPHTMFLFAANTFDGILSDEAVIRKGRIDQIFEIPLPSYDDRKEIIKQYADEFNVKFEVGELQRCIDQSDGLTGAELRELCIQLQRASLDECLEQNNHVQEIKERYKPKDDLKKLNRTFLSLDLPKKRKL